MKKHVFYLLTVIVFSSFLLDGSCKEAFSNTAIGEISATIDAAAQKYGVASHSVIERFKQVAHEKFEHLKSATDVWGEVQDIDAEIGLSNSIGFREAGKIKKALVDLVEAQKKTTSSSH